MEIDRAFFRDRQQFFAEQVAVIEREDEIGFHFPDPFDPQRMVRIGRSIREGKNSSPDYGSESEMFRDLCRRKLISPEEYKKIQTRLRDRLVSDVLNRNPASSGPADERNAAPDPELEKVLRLQALLRGEKTRR